MKRSEMKKQTIFRDYNCSDAELYVLGMEILQLVRKDADRFAKMGIDETRLTAYTHICQRFKDCPDDDEMVGEQMVFTEKKNAAVDELQNAIRAVMNRVATVFSNRTGRYRQFGTAKMGDMSDPQLLFCGRRVVRVARQQMPLLEGSGLLDGHNLRVQEAVETLERRMNLQQDKLHDRDIAVELRSVTGNELYREFVAICHIGKMIWKPEVRAKYEHFVIYESNNEQKKARKKKLEEGKL